MGKKATTVAKTRFWEFDQNNSGGSFDIEDERGLGPRVWIEAVYLGHAVSRALALGIYFDGVSNGMDCGCCGDRWSEPYGNGEPLPHVDPRYDFVWHDTVYVHGLDGTIKRITKAMAEAA